MEGGPFVVTTSTETMAACVAGSQTCSGQNGKQKEEIVLLLLDNECVFHCLGLIRVFPHFIQSSSYTTATASNIRVFKTKSLGLVVETWCYIGNLVFFFSPPLQDRDWMPCMCAFKG